MLLVQEEEEHLLQHSELVFKHQKERLAAWAWIVFHSMRIPPTMRAPRLTQEICGTYTQQESGRESACSRMSKLGT